MAGTPTETDAAALQEFAQACTEVRVVSIDAGAQLAIEGSASLLHVIDGQLSVGGTAFGRGEIALVNPPSTVEVHSASTIVEVTVDEEWEPAGERIDPAEPSHDDTFVEHMFVVDDQAQFRPLRLDDRRRKVEHASLTSLPGGLESDWHTEERVNVVFVVKGGFELEVGGEGGSRRLLGPGDLCVVEDLEGQGHITRTRGDTTFAAYSVSPEDVWTKETE